MSKSKTPVEETVTQPEAEIETETLATEPEQSPEPEAPVDEDAELIAELEALEAEEAKAKQETPEPVQEEPVADVLPVVKEPVAVETVPEPEVPADTVPVARNGGNKKGLVRANVNAKTVAPLVFSLDGIVKHKHGFDLAEATGPLKEFIDFLDSYEERMNPHLNLDELVGESLQKQLYKNYLKALGLSSAERGIALEVVLWKFFENNNQVWRVSNLSRYTRNGKWNIAELQMFVQLSNLFNLVKDPAERIARIRSINLGRTVYNFPSDKAVQTEALIAWATSLK